MESNLLMKRKIIKLMLFFLMGMFVFTIISNTLYTFLLPKVQVEKVKLGMVETRIVTTGKIGLDEITTKSEKSILKSAIAGQIMMSQLEEGQEVKSGEELLVVKKIETESERAQREVEKVEIQIEKEELLRQKQVLLDTKEKEEKELLIKKEASSQKLDNYELLSIEEEIRMQETTFNLNKKLYNEELLAKEEYDASKEKLSLLYLKKVDKEKEITNKNKEEIKNLEENLLDAIGKIAEIQGKIILNEAKRIAKEETVVEEKIISPINGYIYELNVKNGDMITSTDQIISVVPVDIKEQLIFNVPTKQADKISVGQDVNWLWNNNKERAVVVKKSYNVEADTMKITCEIDKELLSSLALGYKEYKSVDVEIVTNSENYNLIVPNSAIISEGAGNYVYSVEEVKGLFNTSYVVHKRQVFILKTGDTTSAIEGSIMENDQVIKSTNKALKDGIEVMCKLEVGG